MKKTKPYEIIEAKNAKIYKNSVPLGYHYLVMVERGKLSQMLENKMNYNTNSTKKSGLIDLTTSKRNHHNNFALLISINDS